MQKKSVQEFLFPKITPKRSFGSNSFKFMSIHSISVRFFILFLYNQFHSVSKLTFNFSTFFFQRDFVTNDASFMNVTNECNLTLVTHSSDHGIKSSRFLNYYFFSCKDVAERENIDMQILADCYAVTTMNLAMALGFFLRMRSLQSLERSESEHRLVTVVSVESWPGVWQMIQKHIKGWKVCLKAELGPQRKMRIGCQGMRNLWELLWQKFVGVIIQYICQLRRCPAIG